MNSRKSWWQQATAVVSLSAGGAITGFSFTPKVAADLKSPSSMMIHLMALQSSAKTAPANDSMLRSAIVNVASYYLRMAAGKTPAEMEAIIWQHDSIDGVDHGESCAAFASLTLELAAQVVGQQSWVTGGTSYPWPLHKWADVRVDTNPASPGIVSVLQDAQTHQRWHPLGDGYTPLPGDWVLFHGHVEVVTQYSGGVLRTIGGDSLPNFSVNAHEYSGPLGDDGVVGFVDNGELPAVTTTTPGGQGDGTGGQQPGQGAFQAAPTAPARPAAAAGTSGHAGLASHPGSGGTTNTAARTASTAQAVAVVAGAPGQTAIPGAVTTGTAQPASGRATADAAVPGMPATAPPSGPIERPARRLARPGPSRTSPGGRAVAPASQGRAGTRTGTGTGTATPASAGPSGPGQAGTHAGSAGHAGPGQALSADVPGTAAAPRATAAETAARVQAATPGATAIPGLPGVEHQPSAGSAAPSTARPAAPATGRAAVPGTARSAAPAAAPTTARSAAPSTGPATAPYSRHQPSAPAAGATDTSAQQAFIDEIAPGAMATQRKYGVPAAVTIAQAIDESGWGESGLAARDHNLFGVKGAGPAGSDPQPTQEYEDGQWVIRIALFRVYRDAAESIADHGKLLAASGYYRRAMADRQDPNAFANALTGVYATDPEYGAKLIGLMQHFDLYRYDAAAPARKSHPPAPSGSTIPGLPHTSPAPTVSTSPTPTTSSTPAPITSTSPAPTTSTSPPPTVSAAPTPTTSTTPTPTVSASPGPTVSASPGPSVSTSPASTVGAAPHVPAPRAGRPRSTAPASGSAPAPVATSARGTTSASGAASTGGATSIPGTISMQGTISIPGGTATAAATLLPGTSSIPGAMPADAGAKPGSAAMPSAPASPGTTARRRAATKSRAAAQAPAAQPPAAQARVAQPRAVQPRAAQARAAGSGATTKPRTAAATGARPASARLADAYEPRARTAPSVQTVSARRGPAPANCHARRTPPRNDRVSTSPYQAHIPLSVRNAFTTTARVRLIRAEPLYRDVASLSGIRWELLAACDWMQCEAQARYSPVHGEKLGTVNHDGTVYRTKSEALEQCAEDLVDLADAVYGIDLTARTHLSVRDLASVFAAFRWGGLLKLHHTSAMEFPYSVAGLTAQHVNMRWPRIAEPNTPDKPGARFRMPFGAVPVVLGLNYPATV